MVLIRIFGWGFNVTRLAAASAVLAISSEYADEPDAFHMECYDGDTRIFVSDIAELSQFDATARGVALLQAIPLPQDGVTLYQFGPADVFCLVANE